MGRLLGVLRLFRHDILVMLLSLKSRQTPRKVKGMMLLAIFYLLSPIDLIPDAIPVFGMLDDAVLVPAAIAMLMRMLPYPCGRTASARPTTSCAMRSSPAYS